jgi:hypothetical protein
MLTDFTTEYSQRRDDELLQLSSERSALTAEAVDALDVELLRRNLTEADQAGYQKFKKQQGRRERRHRRIKLRGTYEDRLEWREVLCAFFVMGVITATYLSFPSRYRLSPDWEEAAAMVMISSTLIFFLMSEWQEMIFLVSLAISSVIHLLLAHAVMRRFPDLSRAAAKGVMVLGLVIFAVVYFGARFLQRSLYGTSGQAGDDARIE